MSDTNQDDPRVGVSASIPLSHRRHLDEIVASRRGTSRARLIADAIEHYVNTHPLPAALAKARKS